MYQGYTEGLTKRSVFLIFDFYIHRLHPNNASDLKKYQKFERKSLTYINHERILLNSSDDREE